MKKALQNLHSRHVTQAFLKTGKHSIVARWVPHWIKFQVFSSLQLWKRNFWD